MYRASKNLQTSASGRLFAIGDIHGCPDELSALLTAINLDSGDTLVFMGDYIDRGPASRDVIEILLEMKRHRCRTVFLKGNHEDMMLSFLGFPGRYGESFLLNGGIATLLSYGVEEDRLAETLDLLPTRHVEFLNELQTQFVKDSYLFVHAGVHPLKKLEEQEAEDLMWIRQEFILHPHELDLTVVFGHTPMREVLFDLPYKIGIDTGLVYGGKLTCLELTEGLCHQVARGSTKVKRHSIVLA